jgi:serine O-acetyltransferase
VRADVLVTAAFRGEPITHPSRPALLLEALRLSVVSDAFFAQVCYRVKAALQARGVPLLPSVAHRLAMISGQVCIGDPVVVAPGVYLPHGQVVIDGLTEIRSGCSIAPFVTVGLLADEYQGPVLGRNVWVGTGAKILGPVTVGDRARIGANSVVTRDVVAGTTVAGVPARPVGASHPDDPTPTAH